MLPSEDKTDSTDSALEQFRRQWREEVSTRAKNDREGQGKDKEVFEAPPSEGAKPPIPPLEHHPTASRRSAEKEYHSQEGERSGTADQLCQLTYRDADDDDDEFTIGCTTKEPKSALEHYERAVEKENQGNLGDSLSHYRKAYRLDAGVDLSYKHKHFPTKSKPAIANSSNAAVAVPSTAHRSLNEPIGAAFISRLIEKFSDLPILGAPPVVDGGQPPPCPIRRLPPEILSEILRITAILDPASFARSAVVCKRFAYHVFGENQIWKRVALGPEFGLAGQVYDFQTDLQGHEAINQALDPSIERPSIDESVFKDPFNQDWREVFHSHPRIRFTGVYISTVNYTRAGGASASQTSWNSPVHIVTYYRYLRFFRDGTLISLLSTNEPIEVVHHLTKENLAFVRVSKEHHPLNFTSTAPAINGPPAQPAPPTAHQLMKHALRGRWRLGHPLAAKQHTIADTQTAGMDTEGDVYIETEGAGPRYIYTMQLALKSSSKSKQGVKNNKLQWKGFWSYNQLTNDWAPFQLKNDRAFFFSRVKSYGLGY